MVGGKIMDSFVDKIAQKFNGNGQDVIRANAEAEAAEMKRVKIQAERMQKQLEQYDICIQEMRQLNLKNEESAQVVQELSKDARTVQEMIQNDISETADRIDRLIGECITRINGIQAANGGDDELMTKLADLQERISEHQREQQELQGNLFDQKYIIEETQKVITDNRDTLADIHKAVTDSSQAMEEMRKSVADSGQAMEEIKNTFSENKGTVEEVVHKENIKVYRNIQAAVTEELGKQSKDILAEQYKAAGMNKVILAIIIASLVAGLGNLGLMIVHVLGIL